MSVLKFKGVKKDYSWGNDSFISSLLGEKKSLIAEYWMGTHEKGEALCEDGKTLKEEIGHKLSFLFKVLSSSSPLSIQVHPDKEQAEGGWKKEEVKREGGEECDYTDPNDKEEVYLALTPSYALFGFREFDEAKELMNVAIPISYSKYFSTCTSIEEIINKIFSFDLNEKYSTLNEVQTFINKYEFTDSKLDYVLYSVINSFPEDETVLFSLLMNTVFLKEGEALYIPPRTLHSYVYGSGMELMSSSDNVLRAGLTEKRVDRSELLSIMSFDSTKVKRVRRITKDGMVKYSLPSSLELYRQTENEFIYKGNRDYVFFCAKGSGFIKSVNNEKYEIKKGEAYIVSDEKEVCLHSYKGSEIYVSSRK